ncbi:putative peroxiredoxin [Botrimarina colliarenosi]|uniref:Putative peroxiredoxin n=1 Tax=Botrimarina colliarenosi TaxID=2528001 RepID=A0A5C6A9W8_9BACT|nr:thioredoxin family protein [Botrimarina colliarenosi]TWT96200.1 putative peroxiredoxin [Botrimarina colliarenosi]
MVRTPSTMLPLGTAAPDFSLPSALGETVSLAEFKSPKGLLVMFICNHCPFVIHLADALAAFGKEYHAKGLDIVAISANDADAYPADSIDKMALEAEARGYTFPYLYDGTQDVAKAYRAACTPDFFLFDGDHQLAYRGQFDSTRPDSGLKPTGEDLRAACDAVLAGDKPSEKQLPSIGCNIKWKPGGEPDYFN